MANEKTAEKVVEKTEKITLTIRDGIRFGIGFFMVNAVCLAAIGFASWLIVMGARYFGLAF